MRPFVAFLLLDKSPNFVPLNLAHRNLLDAFGQEPHISAERLQLRVLKPLTTRLALPKLNPALVATGFHRLDFAIAARHFGPCFLRAFASKMAVGLSNPAFGASPRLGPVSS
jgi:hypothetical protein